MKKVSVLLLILYFVFGKAINGGLHLLLQSMDHPFLGMVLQALVFVVFGFLLAGSFPIDLQSIDRYSFWILTAVFLVSGLSQILYFAFTAQWLTDIVMPMMDFRQLGQVGLGYVLYIISVKIVGRKKTI